MPIDPGQTIYYKRARFTTRLPLAHRYAPSHFWLAEESSDIWRVGLTKFATRMLGGLVEFRFETVSGDLIAVGQPIGYIEGFKAVSDIYCVIAGEFEGSNPEMEKDPALLDRDPYDRGWLYRVRGRPTEPTMDVSQYIQQLDATIDRMLEQSLDHKEKSC
jgi:glycine cleavage system H protein